MSEAPKKFKFKCCATKTHGYFCCAVCLGLYHTSCLERDFKGHTKINENKIYCSEKCLLEKDSNNSDGRLNDALGKMDLLLQSKHSLKRKLAKMEMELNAQLEGKDDLIASLTEEVDRLRQEILSSQAQFSKRRRNSLDFEKLALEQEQEMVEMLNEKQIEIVNLRKEIGELTSKNQSLENGIVNHLGRIKHLEKELEELNTINRKMIVSISTLEAENHSCYSEIKRLRIAVSDKFGSETEPSPRAVCHSVSIQTEPPVFVDINDGFSLNVTSKVPESSVPNVQNNALDCRKKMLILCDQSGRGLVRVLREKLHKDYSVQCLIKPNASFLDVIVDIDKLVKSFSKDDCVIVLAGEHEFCLGSLPKVKAIWQKVKFCTHTNLIFLSHPNIRKFNATERIDWFYSRFCSFIDRVNQFSEGEISFLFSGNKSKGEKNWELISENILGKINLYKKLIKNLIFIPILNRTDMLSKVNDQSKTSSLVDEEEHINNLISQENQSVIGLNDSFLERDITNSATR